MIRTAIALLLGLVGPTAAWATSQHDEHEQAIPTLNAQPKTEVAYEKDKIIVTFGPVDVPAPHSGDLAASMPHHFFKVPKDRYLTGYKSEVFTKDGKALPRQYLHHILLINNDKESVSCPGEPLFFAGAGLEMTEARFPEGYGVKLEKGKTLMAVVAFYHGVPPTKDVMARFTMEVAPEGAKVAEMDVYQVGVNTVCYSKYKDRKPGETDEGIPIEPGLNVSTAPLKFRQDGCVKFAYPHGHDQLLMIALEDKTDKKTLLRTVPRVAADGSFIGFEARQVYQDPRGFPVLSRHDYEISMVYHRPLDNPNLNHGMGNYLLYMTPGACPASSTAAR
jgi:hypothetical protein